MSDFFGVIVLMCISRTLGLTTNFKDY